MKILFLAQRVPYPPVRGDKIATWHFLSHLRQEHEVRVVCFAHDAQEDADAESLRATGVEVETFRPRGRLRALPRLLGSQPLTLGVFGSDALAACVDRRVGEVDLAFAYSSSMGAFLLHHELPRLMYFAELDSDKWRQYAGSTGLPMRWIYAREARTLLAFERELARSVDASLVCTPLEREVFRRWIPDVDPAIVRMGVDVARFHPQPERAEPDHVVFVGVMNYWPNVEGCLWFCEAVLPRLRELRPDVRFSIVGAHPTKAIRALGSLPGVTVTGWVEDPVDWFARASVAVAPLRIARGIQNKVLESLAMGLPVVGTTCATQGIEGEPGAHYLVEDEPQGLARRIAELLADPEAARALGCAGRRFVEERYPWERTLLALDALVAEHAPRRTD